MCGIHSLSMTPIIGLVDSCYSTYRVGPEIKLSLLTWRTGQKQISWNSMRKSIEQYVLELNESLFFKPI